MIARNDITGDAIVTGGTTENYRTGWDRIFGKKPEFKEADDSNPQENSDRSDQGEVTSSQ